MQGGIAVIKAGGRSDLEVKECKERIEDALCAVRAALEEGIVIGGGCALLYAGQSLKLLESELVNEESNDFIEGIKLVDKVCQLPLRYVYSNANGLENPDEAGNIVYQLLQLNNRNMGYDAKTKEIKNLIDSNIMDPVKVVKSTLRYGAGLASILLTAEASVIEDNYNFARRVHDQIKL